MKETLDALQSVQGQSVEELEKQLKDSQEILDSMDDNFKADLMNNIVTILLAGDENGDMLLSDEEIDEIIHELESVHGVNLNDTLLRKIVIDKGRSITGVMEVARHLLSDTIPEDQNIFSFVQE
jgi:uncharacterized protein YpuA (DUF1002 family)